MNNIMIIDDHPLIREGLASIINAQNNMKADLFAESRMEALSLLENLEQKNIPDAAIIDISLKDSNGMDLIEDLKEKYPQLKILVLSMFDETIYAPRALKNGALGYIMKEKVSSELLKALDNILKGKIYLSEAMSEKAILRSFEGGSIKEDTNDILSDRELQVLELIGKGLTTNEIAQQCFLGTKTVESYKSRIKEKLKLKNANQLLKFAVEWLLIHRK